MTRQQELQALHKKFADELKSISDRPDEWLPHTVFVEDVCDIDGTPAYFQYKLVNFSANGECQLLNSDGGEEPGGLCEIETEGLIALLNRYSELTGKHIEAK